jgi:hypothetical protein
MSPSLDRRAWLAVGAVFVLALVVRFSFWSTVRGTALDEWHRYDQSDMATYLAQADQFASGDWLAREPIHPYHGWQTVAPPEKWLEWYGPHVFHQAPGYAYALAAARSVWDEPLALVKALQLVLGALSAAFACLLAREVFGLATGVVAGVLVATYAPLFHLEAQLLREGPALCALFALSFALVRELHTARATRGVWLACGSFGVALGLFHVFHEMGTLLLASFGLVLSIHHGRGRRSGAVHALAALLVGYVVGFAPLLARNVAVDAPPFSVSCRTLINFAEANEADAAEGGATFIAPGPAVVKILDEADGSFTKMLAGVWATYDGDVARFVGNWWQRWKAIWKTFEEPDNTSFYFFREYVPALKAAPTFTLVFPLAVAGLLAAAFARRRGGGSDGSGLFHVHPSGQAALVVVLVTIAVALSFVHTVARFRLYVTPALLVFAAAALVLAWRCVSARRFGAFALLAVVVVLGATAQNAITRETESDRFRPVDFFVAATISSDLGDHAAALAFADDSARTYTGDFNLYVVVGQRLEAARQWRLAATAYQRALARLPGSVDARNGLARAEAQLGAGR